MNTNQIIEGEALKVLETFPTGFFDCLIIDPPYSSGGAFRGDRMADTNTKYTQGDVVNVRPNFGGDNRDQRSFAYWSQLWLSEALRVAKPGAPIVMFTDWRQLPTMTDALQAGGWVWRGIAVWDKTEGARPTLGRFSSQCEYLVWGSAGPMPLERLDGAPQRTLPGVFRVPVKQADKHHVTGKPTDLMRQVVKICRPGRVILDCFAGSGSTLVAAKKEGFDYVGIEMDPHYAQVCRQRLGQDEEPQLFAPLFADAPAISQPPVPEPAISEEGGQAA